MAIFNCYVSSPEGMGIYGDHGAQVMSYKVIYVHLGQNRGWVQRRSASCLNNPLETWVFLGSIHVLSWGGHGGTSDPWFTEDFCRITAGVDCSGFSIVTPFFTAEVHIDSVISCDDWRLTCIPILYVPWHWYFVCTLWKRWLIQGTFIQASGFRKMYWLDLFGPSNEFHLPFLDGFPTWTVIQ